MHFGLRFDFRNPDFAGVAMADRFGAAIDMVEWAEGLGAISVAVSEHHGSDDGYLPSPLPVLSAMAARTSSVRFMVAALIAPFYDPIRLAEDIVVLDHLSRGRVDLIVAAGYVPREFEMYGVPSNERGRRLTETIEVLRGAFSGEPFEYRGRTVHVTPRPFREHGPGLLLGGSSEAAARRAARLGDGFIPTSPDVWEFYCDELALMGRDHPGDCPTSAPVIITLADDVERGWERIGPYYLHDTNAYGRWKAESGTPAPFAEADDVDGVRAAGTHVIMTPDEFVAEMRDAPFPFYVFHPMVGGIPPELAWESLHLFEHHVLPAFA